MKPLRVIVACEFSGRVREAFAARGWDAWSVDLLPSELPGQHYQGDAIEFVRNTRAELLIAHPPCTYLCNSGVRWFTTRSKRADIISGPERHFAMSAAVDFFKFFLDYEEIPCRAIENPIMHMYARIHIGRYTQIIQPWMFGALESKATGLWLRNLPALKSTNIVEPTQTSVHYASPGPERWKERSRTFHEIADAMATQWTKYFNEHRNPI